MSDLISKEDLLNGIYNDAPKDVMKYIAEFPIHLFKGDLISRPDAIDAVVQCHYKAMSGYDWIRRNEAIDKLKALPSADERKKGEWIEYNATGEKLWMCSECCVAEKNPKVANFCYWCGADMRGEKDE